ncbi:MAG: FkbM family methyltransferase [Verrucomicrobiota bacterium]
MFVVFRLLPLGQFLRWLVCLSLSAWDVLKYQSLGPVDRKFGECFAIRANHRWLYFENTAFGVMREIFGHQCYVSPHDLANAKHILDLGANGGAFTLFALAYAPHARVHAVEAQAHLAEALKKNIQRNGFETRTTWETSLVGGNCNHWTQKFCEQNPSLKEFSIQDYLAKVGTCDFLKCDIEGAEYAFFSGDLSWLSSIRKIALEYHGDIGDALCLRDLIQKSGFDVQQEPHGRFGYFFCQRI